MKSGWHPIFAAPKDGTEILASDYDAIEIVSWTDRSFYLEPFSCPGQFPVLLPAGWYNRRGQPFHAAWWQPLPDHPPLP